jgi:hypothetical protein
LFVTVTDEQLSLVVGVPRITPVAAHPEVVVAVTVAGAVMEGETRSMTVTVWVAVDVFPAPSVTVHVTVVVPIGKELGALLLTVPAVQLSAVNAFPMLLAVTEHVAPAGMVMFAGATSEGAPWSTTITVCVAVAVFPLLSVTVQVTVVAPKGNTAGALLVTEATPQLSAVNGVPRLTLKEAQLALA